MAKTRQGRRDGAALEARRFEAARLFALTVERLPGYAPALNPIEQVWGNVKGGELANVCAADLAALRQPAHRGSTRVRRQSHLVFLRHAGLTL